MFLGVGEIRVSVLRRGGQVRFPVTKIMNSDPALMRLRLVKKDEESEFTKIAKIAKQKMPKSNDLMRLRMVKKSGIGNAKKTESKVYGSNSFPSLLRLRMVKKSESFEIRKRMFRLFRILPI